MQVDHGLEAVKGVLVSADVNSGVASAAAFFLIQVSATSHKCFNYLVLMRWRIADVGEWVVVPSRGVLLVDISAERNELFDNIEVATHDSD